MCYLSRTHLEMMKISILVSLTITVYYCSAEKIERRESGDKIVGKQRGCNKDDNTYFNTDNNQRCEGDPEVAGNSLWANLHLITKFIIHL